MDNKTLTTIRVNKFALMGRSQSPRDVTTANLRLVKNVVEPQKFAQELRVSYKPTAFRRLVVDIHVGMGQESYDGFPQCEKTTVTKA